MAGELLPSRFHAIGEGSGSELCLLGPHGAGVGACAPRRVSRAGVRSSCSSAASIPNASAETTASAREAQARCRAGCGQQHHLRMVPGVQRPTSRTPSGYASSWGTGSCGQASCRRGRSAGCAISRGCARRRSTSADHRAVVHDPGLQVHAAQVLIAEFGLDMARCPTVRLFVSSAGARPGHHESAGRRRSGQTRPRPRWPTERAKAAAPPRAPTSPPTSPSCAAVCGEPKAIGAIRHEILVAYYDIVRDQVPFRELGPGWQRKRYSVEHRARRLQRQLQALGYTVTRLPAEEYEPTA